MFGLPLFAILFAMPTVQDGKFFQAMCEAWDKPQRTDTELANAAVCYAYVQGFVDSMTAYEDVQRLAAASLHKMPRPMACWPVGIPYYKHMRAVIDYMKAHPRELSKQRDEIVMDALAAAYPCPEVR